jgi:hypothetical protein
MQLGIVGGETIGSQLTPKQGFSPIGLPAPGGWGTTPSGGYAVAASVTVTTTGTIDWSVAGIFQFQLTTADAFAPTFKNAMVGQVIFIALTQPASSTAATLTLPTGTTVSGTAAGTITISSTNSAIDVVRVMCTAPGVYLATLN